MSIRRELDNLLRLAPGEYVALSTLHSSLGRTVSVSELLVALESVTLPVEYLDGEPWVRGVVARRPNYTKEKNV